MLWDDVEIVPLEMALNHLRLVDPDEEQQEDVEAKLLQAHGLVLDYVHRSRPQDDDWDATLLAWTEATAPKAVQAAILAQLSDLSRFRGDDERAVDGTNLSPYVQRLLRMYADPVIA